MKAGFPEAVAGGWLEGVERRHMKHAVYLINFLARFLGVAAIFAGIAFLVSAYAIVENRIQNIVVRNNSLELDAE
jgi:hypothetical protein